MPLVAFEGFQICDDRLRIRMIHVVDVHGRAQNFAFRTSALLQDAEHLRIGEARQAGKGRHVIGPILDGANGSNPDRRALQPRLWIQVSLRIPGSPEMPITATLAGLGEDTQAKTKDEGGVTAKGSTGKDIAKVAAPTITAAGIGAIVGGAQGAGIGAGVGVAVVLLTRRGQDVELKRGSTMEIVLDRQLCIK